MMISSPFYYISQMLSILVALFIGVGGYRKKSLDLSGALGAILVGYLTLRAGLYETIVLLFFFYSSSKLTKFKSEIKKKREDGFKEGEGHRNWEQVLANGGFPTAILLLISAIVAVPPGGEQYSVPIFQIFSSFSTGTFNQRIHLFLMSAFLGVYCANCGDTWSSEVGILSTNKPRFILAPWKQVPFGTNGGVSLKGFSAALTCGVMYGLITMVYMYAEMGIRYYTSCTNSFTVHDQLLSPRYPILFLTIFASLFGTVLDSVLGAIFEYSGLSKRKGVILKQYDEKEDFGDNLQHIAGYDLLSGCQVNYISGVVTGLLTGLLALYIF